MSSSRNLGEEEATAEQSERPWSELREDEDWTCRTCRPFDENFKATHRHIVLHWLLFSFPALKAEDRGAKRLGRAGCKGMLRYERAGLDFDPLA